MDVRAQLLALEALFERQLHRVQRTLTVYERRLEVAHSQMSLLRLRRRTQQPTKLALA